MIRDIDEHEGKLFISMELLDGQPVDHRISGRPPPVKEVLDVAIQISKVLEAAHAKSIIHRDIKSSNVFVGEQSMAKVLNSGLAKIQKPAGDLTASTSLTEQDALLGMIPDMTRKQLRSEAVDVRTDLHALGPVLYEMATRRRALTEALGPPLVDAILHELPLSPQAFSPKVPPELERIFLKCAEKALLNRYQSAKELAVDSQRLKRETESGRSAPVSPGAGAAGEPAPRQHATKRGLRH
jgi:serine/threonine protein kinase